MPKLDPKSGMVQLNIICHKQIRKKLKVITLLAEGKTLNDICLEALEDRIKKEQLK